MEVLQINEVKQRFRDLNARERLKLQEMLSGPEGQVIRKVLGPAFVQEFIDFFASEKSTFKAKRGLASR